MRALAAAAVVMTVAGCGGTVKPPTLHFKSRPDLSPPPLTIVKALDGAFAGDVFIAPKMGAPGKGAAIYDAAGNLVWFDPVAPADQITDFRVQTYDGQPVLTFWEGPVKSPILGTGFGHYVILDSHYEEIKRVQAGFGNDSGDIHEFQLTDHGTALITVYKLIKGSLAAIGGPKKADIADSYVQEIDLKTGKMLFDWDALKHVPVTESYIPLTGPGAPLPGFPYDPFHANSVEEDTDGNLIVSARNTCAIYKIDRKTGDIIWRLGGKKSDFKMGPGTTFWWQHDARRRADGTLTLYDDGAAPPHEPLSRGLRLKLDESAMTATLVQAVTHVGVLAGSQGNMQVLPNGDSLVGFGAIPRLTEFTPSGGIDFDATFPDKEDSYRAYRFRWSGQPVTRPAIATARGRGGTKTIYASWNGATGVTSWQVLAGNEPGELAPVAGPQAASGFETVLRADTNEEWIAVEARDSAGKVLGTSQAVPISGGLSPG
jgi:hypothetical protein